MRLQIHTEKSETIITACVLYCNEMFKKEPYEFIIVFFDSNINLEPNSIAFINNKCINTK